MADEILPGLYRIEIPLPKSPLRAVNSYVIKAQGRFLIIDTGLNLADCRLAMSANLAELRVDLAKTDFFITHSHADHLGLVPDLASGTSRVYLGDKDAAVVSRKEGDREGYYGTLHSVYSENGFPEDELEKASLSNPGRGFSIKEQGIFSRVQDGDRIEIGDYSFRCVETPGHTPGHMCLYEPKKKILVSGDHILFDITPNITCWYGVRDTLQQYLGSLNKVYDLDVSLVLPGHRSIMADHRRRITELRAHHQDRLNEVLSSLQGGEKTAYQVAPFITWDIDCASWERFPASQKWFAFGETLAHLYHLEGKGLVRERGEDHRVVFSLV